MPNFPVFETAAPSVSAGSHEMRESFSNPDPPRSSPYTAPSITPYLGLRSRLSQIWFNRWTVLILLVLARVLIACAGINNKLASTKADALSACSTVEAMGSVMASMPHYLSQGVNEMAATGIEKSVNALMQTSTLAVTGIEEIAVFVVNMMYGTYLCLLTLAVNGSVSAAINVLNDAQQALNNLTQSLGNDMSGVVNTFLSAYNNGLKELGSGITAVTGVNFPSPLDLSGDITKLQQLQIPSSIADSINKLNSSVQAINFDATNFTDTIVRLPFEDVKSQINSSIGHYTFNRSIFPVPQREKLSFCSTNDGITDFFDGLADLISNAIKIFIAVLVIAAVLVCIPMAYREIRRWRTMKRRSHLVADQKHDPLDVVYIVSRPYTATAGIKISDNLQSSRRQILVRWVVAYATSEPALFVLALAVAGLFSCLCQYILLKSIQQMVPGLTAQVSGFADLVVEKLNATSEQWANATNGAIQSTGTTINNDLFGWVNQSATTLNNTLNTFVDTTNQVLDATFGGTPLHDPLQDVLKCLVTLKIEGIQRGLTWMQDNAHISLPLVANDTLSRGAAAAISSDQAADQSFLATPGDVASDKISSVVDDFVDSMVNEIRTETLISACILAVYLIAVLSAIIRAATLWFGRDKVRGEGGAAPNESEVQEVERDFRSDQQDRYVNFDNIPLGAISNSSRTSVQANRRSAIQPTEQVRPVIQPGRQLIPRVNHQNEPVSHAHGSIFEDSTVDYNGPAPRYSTAIEEKAAQEALNNPFADAQSICDRNDFYGDHKI